MDYQTRLILARRAGHWRPKKEEITKRQMKTKAEIEQIEFCARAKGDIKFCRGCDSVKRLDRFNKDKNNQDGVQSQCRECKRKAQKSDYEKKKETYLIRQNERRSKAPLMQKAHSAVFRAIKRGDLIRPTSCSLCGESEQRIEAHHHLGYEVRHQLDVVFLCTSCHRSEENKS